MERLRTDPDSSVRAGCLLGLDALFTFEAERYDLALVTPGILAALEDPAPRVVRSACLACDTLELKAAIPTLAQLLESPSLAIRRAVIRPLFNLGERGEALVAVVRDLLQNPGDEEQPWERSSLERTLAELEAEAAPGEAPTPEAQHEDQLRQALALMETEVGTERRKGADLLHRLGGPVAVERLKSALEDPEPSVRSYAALALGRWKVREALPALIDHLTGDPSLHVRRLSGAFIHYFEEDRAEAVAGLVRALNDEDRGIVEGACVSLGLLGDRSVIPVLLRLLDREEWSVRQDAA